jgi:DNA repair exonuclease SbcCD nuclease subunit
METTKVLTIGDVHIKVNNIPECKDMITRLVQLAQEKKPDFIVCLGDVLDRHSTIHVQCLMIAEEFTFQMSQIAPFFLIVGNHDRPNNSNFLTNEHPFNAMKKWDNVTIVDKVVEYFHKDQRFIMVPYVPPGRFDEALQTISDPFTNVTCYFAHQEIYGAKMGAIVSQCGDKWDLDRSLLVSGHIHDYDHLQPNMIYTGSPIQHSFGDSVSKKISMFTFNDKWEQERIDLGMKKKVTIYITPDEVESFKIPANKIVKVVIRGDESEIKSVTKLDKINQLKKDGVKVAFKITNNVSMTPSEKMSYRHRLTKELGTDLHCISWFNKIF